MSPALYSEDTLLVQQTTAEYLEERLGWRSVYAYGSEAFGPDGTLGRTSEEEVVLTRYLRQALDALNPGLPGEAVDNAIHAIVEVSAAQSMLQTNQEKYDLLRNGVKVTCRDPRGGMETRALQVFDFDAPRTTTPSRCASCGSRDRSTAASRTWTGDLVRVRLRSDLIWMLEFVAASGSGD